MKISRDSWHFKVFEFWAENKKYHEYGSHTHLNKSVNLCPYVRIVLLWAPLRFLLNTRFRYATVAVTAVIGTLINYHFRGLPGLKMEASAILFSFLLFTTIGLLIWGTESLQEQCRKWRGNEPRSTFGKVVIEYVKAAHNGICPTIDFTDKEEK